MLTRAIELNYGIIVAAGKSQRMGPKVDKAFLSFGSKPVLAYSLLAFEKCPDIDGIILVVRKDRLDAASPRSWPTASKALGRCNTPQSIVLPAPVKRALCGYSLNRVAMPR